MDIDQVQRRDIDELGTNTVSLAIDELSNVNESFIDLLTANLQSNNWYSDDGSLSKDMLANNDRLVFSLEAQPSWSYKDIAEVRLVGNIYSSSEISLESIGINSTFTSTDLSINGSTNVDLAFDISEFNQDDLNSLITDKGFDIVINFDSLKTNASVSIIELQVVFVFNDKLQGEKEAIMNRISDLIYPIGSIYMSVNNVNPELLFGGVWEKIEDKFLLASSSNYELGETGGEATHTLTVNEMPSHNHSRRTSPQGYAERDTSGNDIISPASGSAKAVTKTSYNTGGGQAHNNMPPYLVVNMWKRTG